MQSEIWYLFTLIRWCVGLVSYSHGGSRKLLWNWSVFSHILCVRTLKWMCVRFNFIVFLCKIKLYFWFKLLLFWRICSMLRLLCVWTLSGKSSGKVFFALAEVNSLFIPAIGSCCIWMWFIHNSLICQRVVVMCWDVLVIVGRNNFYDVFVGLTLCKRTNLRNQHLGGKGWVQNRRSGHVESKFGRFWAPCSRTDTTHLATLFSPLSSEPLMAVCWLGF